MAHPSPDCQVEGFFPPPYEEEDLPPEYSVGILPNQQRESNAHVRNLLRISATVQVVFMAIAGYYVSFVFLVVTFERITALRASAGERISGIM